MQVREQRAQLKKRAESVARIRDAQESLDERIGQLEEALEEVQSKLEALKQLGGRARQIADRAPAALPPRAANDAETAAYVRV
jgi:DNA repair exonuclease SbcCD ATPase subunit